MKDFIKYYRALSIRLELFTSIVPIPSYVYFVALVGAFRSEEQLISVALSGLFAGGYTVAWGLLYRYFKMRNIFREILRFEENENRNFEDVKKLKIQIMNYPFQEVKVILSRWLVGCTTGVLFYVILQKGEFPKEGVIAIYTGLLFVLPISIVMYLFETEMAMKKILDRPIFYGIEVQKDEIPYFGYFRRILISIISVAITPMSIMGFIIYSMVAKTISFQNPILHIILLSGQSLVSMLVVSHSIAKAVKYGLHNNNDKLEELGKGKFDNVSTRISCDEFGEQGSLIGIISNNLKNMYQEIKDLNQGLEQKVEARTRELNASLNEVNLLKEKQDGDYFLTNLILKPLFKNFNKSKAVRTDFFVKQYKQFFFKKKSGELGGDICITGNLLFYGRPYTMIVNADAMGKSMQGAGGSIVFGTVMNDIMSRSASKRKVLNIDPKEWLRDVYENLHGIFLTFDGSMLISCAMGLIDEENGKLYHFNAEHPKIVLYRDGMAEFIGDEDCELRKLGSPIQTEFSVEEFQLGTGDVLFFGSDGRDDLLIQNSDGLKYMNENEKLFLEVIKESDGVLEDIYEKLNSLGEIKDDISIIRVEYFPLDQKKTEEETSPREILNYIRKYQYSEAMQILDRIPPNEFPGLNYYRGYCLERLGRGVEAIPFLKKGIFHTSTDLHSLRLLAKIYYRAGKFREALEFIEEASALNPKNENVQKELQKIKFRAFRNV